MKSRKLISQRHPILYFLSVWSRRINRYSQWYFKTTKFAHTIDKQLFSFRVKKHQSLLIRKLGNSDLQLQYNKIINLKLAIEKIDGIVIHPGETFSFCKLVGRPTTKKGYVLGMELSFGKARPGIGGGICQIANMLHWLVLHSPLKIVEKSNHSFDPFPDEGRTLPFGSGAAIFYNYIDFQFKNETTQAFQIRLQATEKHLEGELLSKEIVPYSYHIYEQNHQFIKKENEYFRENEIWRTIIDKKSGNVKENELVKKNYAKVMYTPDQFIEIN